MSIRAFMIAAVLGLAGLTVASSPVRADEADQLDLLSRATDDIKPGLALARDQTASGDLLGAMATLERLLINHPESDEAQLLHASLLCRLDDRTGASGEFAALRKRDFRGQAWKDANAPCQVATAAPGSDPGKPASTPTGSESSKARPRIRRPGFD